MLEEKYKKSLSIYEGKYGNIYYYAILFLPIFFLVMAAIKLYAAHRIGSFVNLGLLDYFQGWLAEVEAEREYTNSGVAIMGITEFNGALIMFSLSIILAVNSWVTLFVKKRNNEIIKALNKHGEL